MVEERKVDVFWTVRKGQRHSISLTENEAWKYLELRAYFGEEPNGWSVDKTREVVPVVYGEIVEGEGTMVELDDDGNETVCRAYIALSVFWNCPHCGERHNVSLYDNPIEQTAEASNPSIWVCERGEGHSIVHW